MGDTQGRADEKFHRAVSRFNHTFSQGLIDEVVQLFSKDAKMMWPSMEDIVGREAIRSALGEFFGQFTPLAFEPNRQIVEVCGNKAFTIGRFIEDLAPKEGGSAHRVHGRLVEMWSLTDEGDWVIELLITTRYADNEILVEDSASA